MNIRSSRIQSRVMQLFRTFSWKNISVNEQQPFECSTMHFSCFENFPIWLKTSRNIWSRKNMKRYWKTSKYLLDIARISQCLSVNPFSLNRIKISDLRSLGYHGHRRIRLTCLHPCCHPIQVMGWFVLEVTIVLFVHTLVYWVAQLKPPKWIITWSEQGGNNDVNTLAEYVY